MTTSRFNRTELPASGDAGNLQQYPKRRQSWCCLRLTGLFVLSVLAGCNQSEPSDENRRPVESGAAVVGTTSTGAGAITDPIRSGQNTNSLDPLSSIFTNPNTPYTADPDGENLCYGFDGSQERRVVPRIEKPPFLSYYRDPTFGANIVRITDGQFGEVNKAAYSTMQAWNADESLMILYRTGTSDGGHYLHNGRTYEEIQPLDIWPSDLEDVFWSYNDPGSFYYISQEDDSLGHFLKHDALSGNETLLIDTTQICGRGERAIGGYDVQMHSHDDDTFGFRCLNPANENRSLAFTYRQSTGEVTRSPIGQGTGIPADVAPMVGPSGTQSLIPPVLLDAQLQDTGFEIDRAQTEHASMGRTWNGDDALFSTTFLPSPRGCDDEFWLGVSHLVEFNLEARTCRTILNQSDGWPPTTSGTHVSATAYQRPGWVAMSSIGARDLHYLRMESLENRSAPVFFSEIYLVNTNPNDPAVCRLAQHRTFGREATKGGYDPYFSEPHPTISPSGTRILFSSDWYDSGTVDAYVIELPAYDPDSPN